MPVHGARRRQRVGAERRLVAFGPSTRPAVVDSERDVGAVDEERARLNAAVKADDGFFTTFFVSPYSKYLARSAARAGLTPNAVTSLSLLLGLLAALAFARGTRGWAVAGAVVLQAAFTADCVDGQLARYTRRFSAFGAWLDSVFDRAKEYAVYAGLAAGGVRAGDDGSVWLLAGAALVVQAVRHAMDFSFKLAPPLGVPFQPPLRGREGGGHEDGGHEPADERRPEPVPREQAGAAGSGPAPAVAAPRRSAVLSRAAAGAARLARALDGRGATRWAKRIVVLPIGERFALISVTAALWTPRVTFLALLGWGLLAAAYTSAVRLLRSTA